MVYDVKNLTIVRLVSLQHDETLQQCRYVNFLTRVKTYAEERKVKCLTQKNPADGTRGGGVRAFRKKAFLE